MWIVFLLIKAWLLFKGQFYLHYLSLIQTWKCFVGVNGKPWNSDLLTLRILSSIIFSVILSNSYSTIYTSHNAYVQQPCSLQTQNTIYLCLRNRTLFTEDWCQFYPPLPHISDVCMCSFLHISTKKKNISSPQPASNLTLPWGSLWSFPEEYKWLRQEAQWSWKTQKHSEVKPSGNLMFFLMTNQKSFGFFAIFYGGKI